MRLTHYFVLVLLLFFVSGCSSSEDEPIPTPITDPEEPANNAFLEELLRLGRNHSINRNVIDWTEGRERVYQAFADGGKMRRFWNF